ncbi:MAG: hypothetical protein ACOYJG_00890 [Prevotella sp.]
MARYDEEPYEYGDFPLYETFDAQPGTELLSTTMCSFRISSFCSILQWTLFMSRRPLAI